MATPATSDRGPAATTPARGLSIAALVTGIAGVLLGFVYGLGLFPSIAGVITGNLARKRQPEARALWLTGLICAYVGLVVSVIFSSLLIVALYALATEG